MNIYIIYIYLLILYILRTDLTVIEDFTIFSISNLRRGLLYSIHVYSCYFQFRKTRDYDKNKKTECLLERFEQFSMLLM